MITPFRKSHEEDVLHLFQLNTPTYFDASEQQGFVSFLRQNPPYFVLIENNKLLACGGYALGDDGVNTARICWDMVHPDWHGKGLGAQLVQYRLNTLKQQANVGKVIVRTSQMAYLFYQKQGFHLKFTQKDFWAPSFDLFHMEQTI